MNENAAGRLHRSIDAEAAPWTVQQLRDTLDQFPADASVVVVATADPKKARVFGYDIGGVSHRNLLPPDTAGIVFLVPNTGGGVELVPPPRPQNEGTGAPTEEPQAADHDTTDAARTAHRPGAE